MTRQFREDALPFCLVAIAASFFAQDRVDADPRQTDTVAITLSGAIDMDWVWRGRALTAARGAFGFYGGGFGTLGRGEGVIETQARIRMDVDLSERVRVVLQLENKRLEGGANVDLLGANPEGLNLFAREASIRFTDCFFKSVDISAGVIPWSFDVRGTGHAFFWDPAHAASMTSNVLNGVGGGTGAASLVRDNLQPTGLVISYRTEQWEVTSALLPAIIEGGDAQNDEAGYLVSAIYELLSVGRGSKVGGILAQTSHTVGSGAFSNLTTLGAEASIRQWPLEELELFGAAYWQRGFVGSIAQNAIEAYGFAYELGVRYSAGDSMRFWVEGKFTYLSGDRHQSGADDNIDAFLSYRNAGDLLIIEDAFFGLNWNTNLRAFVFSSALSWPDAKFDAQLTLGFCRAAQDVSFPGFSDTTALGKEIDVRVRWSPLRQASLEFGVAFLVDSEILRSFLGGPGNPDADNATQLFTLAGKIRF